MPTSTQLIPWALLGCVPVLATTQDTFQPVRIHEQFFTSRSFADNIDSVASWHGGDHSWLFSTAKGTHSLVVTDAYNGAFLRRVGGQGSELGQFDRPNGIWIVDDLLFVVERDNARVQVLVLPELRAIGTFGEGHLLSPYGLFIERTDDQAYHVYVTDNYETPDETVPPDRELGKRVVVFEVEAEGRVEGTLDGEFTGYMGATEGAGALRIVESINGDRFHNRLLIAEEDEGHATTGIKVYDFDGNFTGVILGQDRFSGQPEGIALVEHAEGAGFWILADQGKEGNFFHLYDRATLEHAGSFTGSYVLNTDGIWFDPTPSARFPDGVFYAVHNDHSAAAFNWSEVLDALGLR